MSPGQKCVLVAEDDPALGKVIRFNLERAGYQVHLATSGREAWEYVKCEPVHMLLTDEQMPEMSGRELCEALRDSATHRETPVIMITGKGLEFELQDLKETGGIIASFVKPFSPREVVSRVDQYFASQERAAYGADGFATQITTR